MRTPRELNAYAKRARCRQSWPKFDKQEAGEQKPSRGRSVLSRTGNNQRTMKCRKTAPPSQCTSVRGLREQHPFSLHQTRLRSGEVPCYSSGIASRGESLVS